MRPGERVTSARKSSQITGWRTDDETRYVGWDVEGGTPTFLGMSDMVRQRVAGLVQECDPEGEWWEPDLSPRVPDSEPVCCAPVTDDGTQTAA